ncbi:MAG: DinB family protein, partial [Candidatus Rokuibacteriota bacterium]
AWLMWHIARAEDIFSNIILSGRNQVVDDGWLARLKISRPDFGIGMTKPEVAELTAQVSVAALRDYRDEVGRRTQEVIRGFGPSDWQGELQAPALEKAAALGCFGPNGAMVAKAFTGRPRVGILGGLLVTHAAMHMGEAQTVRTAGGFGSGI